MSNYSEAVHYLTSWGLRQAVAEGVCDVLGAESNLDPTAENPQEGAYGIAQWTAGRKAALAAYAQSRRENPETLEAQLHYLVQELNTSELATREALRAATTRRQAIEIWVRQYERPANDQLVIERALNYTAGAFGPEVAGGSGESGAMREAEHAPTLPRMSASQTGLHSWSATIAAAAHKHHEAAGKVHSAASALTALIGSKSNYPRI